MPGARGVGKLGEFGERVQFFKYKMIVYNMATIVIILTI